MLNQGWFRNQNNVVCCRKEEVLPKLARELAIPDLSQRVEEFQKTPTAEGVNISGRKRTTLKLLIPNLTFSLVPERASGTHTNSVQPKLSLLTSTCSVVCLLPQTHSNKF